MSKSLRKEKKLKTEIRLKKRELKYLKEVEHDFLDLFSIYENELNLIVCDLAEYSSQEEEISPEEDLSNSFEFNKDDIRYSFDEDGNLEISNKENIAPEWAKKLYKQIALQTHPDKVQSLGLNEEEAAEREKFFKKSKQLLESGSLEDLVIQAEKLGIEFEIEDAGYLSLLDSGIKKIKNKIDQKKELVPWTWGNLNDDIIEQHLFMEFLLKSLGEKPVPIPVLESYLKAWKNDTIGDWKLFYIKKDKKPQKKNHNLSFSGKGRVN